MSSQKILVVGAGNMAREYGRALASLGVETVVMGRGADSAAAYYAATGVRPGTGPLADQIAALGPALPQTAIVTVNAMYLAEVTAQLAASGVWRMLVEKPAALDLQEMQGLLDAIEPTGAQVYLGYNRRFMASVRRARQMIAEDGGVLSVKFDFSEPSRRIAQLPKPQRELDTWIYGNSSHVLDLAFHFLGPVQQLQARVAGQGLVAWHPAASIFAGSALGRNGAVMSWHANWAAPGRWGVEVMTPERRLILQPLEQLRVQSHAGFAEVAEELPADAEQGLKPGLLGQLRAFLFDEDAGLLPDLRQQAENMRLYDVIRTGGSWQHDA
ncbi:MULTISPECIES: Gfo/Idh/MocA family protein [unclassified Paracoccus (in: a-proteobacteria)]|uniref:Gfo/Idh/MocA family protein n=1 Tax=unclassified Paracoccus (in: a-proteobacteria) TaxID=2688777 RepID=UPI0012B1DD81|nr:MULTISPECIES: Gfo/Idh/MocA family oxidoreductase [unclassified Paracoccus (in: a-proteobacteria)]UXU74435.1 Gfo/Idh/MocA family oxidoreductase [Paracoccus sp. SMMA_5]UXU80325.1 Gfo/Idh/MocA family oxidoreductase [Paracoccus sp. SMMA_5_TC]